MKIFKLKLDSPLYDDNLYDGKYFEDIEFTLNDDYLVSVDFEVTFTQKYSHGTYDTPEEYWLEDQNINILGYTIYDENGYKIILDEDETIELLDKLEEIIYYKIF